MRGDGLIDWLSNLSLAGVILFVFLSMLLVAFAGHGARILVRRIAARGDEDHSQEGYLVGSMLGVLALLMAFSFSTTAAKPSDAR